MSAALSTLIAIPTFRRPEKLAELLEALPARIAEAEHLTAVSVLVVDNDPSASARTVAESFAALPVRYVVESEPGIAAVRNRAIAESGSAELLSFIDDDERPLEGWLSEIVATWQRERTAAVMGRVNSVFEADAEEWVLATGAFRRRARETGSDVAVAAAGNLLLDLTQIRALGVSFDESLGLAGGEDSLFSRQLWARGGRIVWCEESQAEDAVPAERLTRSWVLKRGFNGGNTAVQVDLRMQPRALRRALIRVRGVVGGLARVVAGYAQHLVGVLRHDVARDARGLRTVYRGWGMVAAGFGHHHQEYAR